MSELNTNTSAVTTEVVNSALGKDKKVLKGILANVSLEVAAKFKQLANAKKNNPSRLTKELIEAYVRDNS